MINIVIVDDDILIRESLNIIIGIDSEINVLATLENGKQCIDFLEENEVDVVLLDMRMPIMNGEEVLAELNKRESKSKVLILTTFDEDNFIKTAINNKASGYLLKSSRPEKIINAIKSVHIGNGVFDNEIVSKLGVAKDDKEYVDEYDLTQREMEIVELIAEGLSNKEIANKIFLSEGTVKNHITSILSKMDLKHRTQIAIKYLKK